MGLYLCNKCEKEHPLLEVDWSILCFAACEICGALNDDWTIKPVAWTNTITRYFGRDSERWDKTIREQLAELEKKGEKDG